MNFLIGHLVGDFIFQNDWLAKNKKNNSWICGLHCAIYSFVLWTFVFWPWWAMLIVFTEHFFQDRTDFIKKHMKRVGQESFSQPPMGPWSVIVIDQVFHLWVLYTIAQIVSRIYPT